ncbi:MAG: hypothetical protein Q8K79_18085 [Solirubrobacteraceae bacterium]|nr:hypothetical protein [Solirubrobacteraceae bacterium]
MLTPSRKTLTAIATVSAFAAGGAALAGAATNGSSSSSPSAQRAQDTALTGDIADRVKAAALEKVPGATVLRVEEGGPYATKYHAHVRKSDGTEVVVLVDAQFEATATQARPAGRRGGPGGRGSGGPRHEALTGTAAAKVKAAALEKVPGATVLRSERGGPDGASYHAHVRRSNGTEVVVLVNSQFEATSVQTRPAGGRGGPGHHGGPGGTRGAQSALTGDTAAKVKAAALEKVPGGTVLRTERGGHGAAYHAHVRESDGTEVVVLVNSQFEATAVEEFTRP